MKTTLILILIYILLLICCKQNKSDGINKDNLIGEWWCLDCFESDLYCWSGDIEQTEPDSIIKRNMCDYSEITISDDIIEFHGNVFSFLGLNKSKYTIKDDTISFFIRSDEVKTHIISLGCNTMKFIAIDDEYDKNPEKYQNDNEFIYNKFSTKHLINNIDSSNYFGV